MVDFAGPADAGVERLRGRLVGLQRMGIEQVTALFREDYTALVAAEIDGLDEPLGTEMAENIVVDVEVPFGHHAEGADGSQRAAVLAVQLVDAITIYDPLALLASRQVEVAHQAVARIVVVPVTLVVHARSPVAFAVFTRSSPSSVRHRSLLAWWLLFGLSLKTTWQSLRGVVRFAPCRITGHHADLPCALNACKFHLLERADALLAQLGHQFAVSDQLSTHVVVQQFPATVLTAGLEAR